MIYDLNLNLIEDFRGDENRKQVKERLQNITSFGKRILYYNKEVRSLAAYEKQDIRIYYEWGLPDQTIELFCNCKNSLLPSKFDMKQEAIFQKLRAKEIERLIKGINSQSDYRNKLVFYLIQKVFILTCLRRSGMTIKVRLS